ncbi:MAG: RT0821/Lpp0805 family surface protein [Alphaproteobacteria bacterium]
MKTRALVSALMIATTATLGPAIAARPAFADPWWAGQLQRDHRDDSHHRNDRRPSARVDGGNWRPVIVNPYRPAPKVVVVPGRVRPYRQVEVVRPHGPVYRGYGSYRRDDDAYQWLALTAITLGVLEYLNESQQRALETAQIRATAARVGETITWNDNGASGNVVTLRDGTSTTGRYCREFQQTVTIGGRQEVAYGTACQQPDGAWEVVDTQ